VGFPWGSPGPPGVLLLISLLAWLSGGAPIFAHVGCRANVLRPENSRAPPRRRAGRSWFSGSFDGIAVRIQTSTEVVAGDVVVGCYFCARFTVGLASGVPGRSEVCLRGIVVVRDDHVHRGRRLLTAHDHRGGRLRCGILGGGRRGSLGNSLDGAA